jgi:hypothetical protein
LSSFDGQDRERPTHASRASSIAHSRVASGRGEKGRLDSAALDTSFRPVITSVCLLVVSQVLIFPPGSDVSPYAYSLLGVQTPNTYGGATAQVWSILILIAVCGIGLVRSKSRGVTPGFRWTIVAIIVVAAGATLSGATFSSLAEGIGKLILPLLLFSHLTTIMKAGSHRTLTTLVLAVNVFTIGQSILCKVLTGSFGANTYYLELSEEYFGYFYHPFAFAGIISACSIIVVNELLKRRRPCVMLFLLAVNCFFIYQTQVRTYILAIAVASLVAVVVTTVGRRNPVATSIASALMSLVALVVASRFVEGARVTTDTSSGRLDRWAADVQYFWNTASPADLLVGGGPERIFEVNRALFGVYINSLNAGIDTFVNFGILGLIVVTVAWILLIRDQYRETHNPVILSAVALLLISSVVTSPLEFPAVGSILVIVILALDPQQRHPVRSGTELRMPAVRSTTQPDPS